MSKRIVFSKNLNVSDVYFPQPSSVFLPEWYKKTSGHIGNKKEYIFTEVSGPTIKKCIPVFDALTAGYIIPTYCDILIGKNPDGTISYTPAYAEPQSISFHPIIQAPYHPAMNNNPYPKFLNPWGISTPKGYSCLFMPPVHQGNGYFTILEGIVDTDKYSASVNFPFVLNDTEFEGLIPAGTPMVQVIPFKRDLWKSESGSEKNTKKISEDITLLSSRFLDRYKNIFWERKSYK
jgi:hypothetical protein